MEQSKEYTVNIKDCVKYIVSKWKVLLLVTSIFALLAAGVAAFHYIRQIENVDTLQKELEEDYAINSQNYEETYAKATETLENMTKRVEEQDEYMNASIYLGLDDRNVLTTSIGLYLVMDESEYKRMSYIDCCVDGIMAKTNWDKLAAKYDTLPTYLQEIVKVEPDYEHGIIEINVLYPDETIAGEILDEILANMDSICNEYNFLGEASFRYVNRTVRFRVDDELAEKREEAQKLYQEYVNQLAEGQAQVDAFYAPSYPNFKNEFWKKAILKSMILVVAGILFGAFVVCGFYYIRYVKKGIVFQPSEYRRLTGVEMLGCLDGNADELTYRNIAIKIASRNRKMVLLAGNQEQGLLDKFKTELMSCFETMDVSGIEFLTSDISTDEDFIAKLYTAEAVVCIVECKKTTLSDCLVWEQAVADAKKDLIGNIVI